MTLSVHPLIKEQPELAQDLKDLCDDDPKFAEQVEKFTQLAARLSAVQAGTETLDAEKTELLAQQCNAQKAILVHKLTHPSGGCCGGCGG